MQGDGIREVSMHGDWMPQRPVASSVGANTLDARRRDSSGTDARRLDARIRNASKLDAQGMHARDGMRVNWMQLLLLRPLPAPLHLLLREWKQVHATRVDAPPCHDIGFKYML